MKTVFRKGVGTALIVLPVLAALLSHHPLRSEPADASGCDHWYAGLAINDQAGSALGRELDPRESKALVKALKIGRKDSYSAAEVAKQNKILRKAGFSETEIAQLRRQGPLGNWVRAFQGGEPPSQIFHQELQLGELDRTVLNELKKPDGRKYFYVIDTDDQLHVVPGSFTPPDDALWAISAREAKGAGKPQSRTLLVKEAGELRYDRGGRMLRFHAGYEMDSSVDEGAATMNKLKSRHPGLGLERAARSKTTQATARANVFSCLDILERQTAGKSFVWDKLLVENAVFTGAVLFSDAFLDAHRLDNPRGREIVTADVVGNNITTLLSAQFGKHLVLSERGALASFASRYSMGLAMSGVYAGVYSQMVTSDESDDQSTKRMAFNAGYGLFRTVSHQVMDDFMLNQLPGRLYESCRKGGPSAAAIRIVFSPLMIRVYEKGAFTMLYFGTRKALVGE
ncbi:MAG: hypothetical protein NDJ90_11815 [Oligoflexia bacterium]|nr:hypothetical protein [Oligoflexia bacterium]